MKFSVTRSFRDGLGGGCEPGEWYGRDWASCSRKSCGKMARCMGQVLEEGNEEIPGYNERLTDPAIKEKIDQSIDTCVGSSVKHA